jgi:hypothetical protein
MPTVVDSMEEVSSRMSAMAWSEVVRVEEARRGAEVASAGRSMVPDAERAEGGSEVRPRSRLAGLRQN